MGQINILRLITIECGTKIVINKIGKLYLEVVEKGPSEHRKDTVVKYGT